MIAFLAHVVKSTPSSFWPQTFSAWASIVAGLAASAAAVLGVRNRQRLQIVHTLVDGQLTKIQDQLLVRTGERDQLQYDKDISTPPKVDRP